MEQGSSEMVLLILSSHAVGNLKSWLWSCSFKCFVVRKNMELWRKPGLGLRRGHLTPSV